MGSESKQLAVVVLVKPAADHGTVMHVCTDLNEAFQWSEKHRKDLKPGESYYIYYRCEED